MPVVVQRQLEHFLPVVNKNERQPGFPAALFRC